MEEAGGVGKVVVKELDNVIVNGSTLEIHLYWAGKGTTAIPNRGVYGPLISAITVTPSKFHPCCRKLFFIFYFFLFFLLACLLTSSELLLLRF